MSTQRFMSRICTSPGRFTLAMLLGALLALPCLLPAAVFARASGQTGAISLSSSLNTPTPVLNKVGVSVVRLVAMYGPTGDQITCTGLGVLVASQAPSAPSNAYKNWVLTDGNLINNQLNACGNMGIGDLLSLRSLQVLASNEYTTGSTFPLGSLTCKEGQGFCTDGSPTDVADIITIPSPSAYTLFSFQSAAGEPFVGLSSSNDTTGTNIGLTNPSITKEPAVYPYKSVDDKNVPAANYQDYFTPAVVADPPGNSTGGAGQGSAAKTNPIEGGTPEINAQGQLMGMWVNNSKNGGYTNLPATLLQTLISQHGLEPASPSSTAVVQDCTVATCWNAGIDAYSASNYALAQTDLSKVSTLNPKFIAASKFATLAQHQLDIKKTPQKTATPTRELNPLTGTDAGILDQWPLLIAAAVLVLLVLVILVALVARSRKHRRELAKFGAEFAEGRRIAAEQAAQHQRASQAQAPSVSCPNCHNPVYLTDTICPTCRFPLSPTASGLGVRLMGNAPMVSSALPPLSISEQPTVLFPPSAPAMPGAALNDSTMVRQQNPAQEEATRAVQQVRGRNLSLAVGTRSDPGIKRKHKPNEDSMFAFQWDRTHNSQHQQFGLFVVADGMGGHANGQDASRLAIQTIIDFMLPQVTGGEQLDDESFLKLMGDGVQASNVAVHNRNMESHADMGTTMTAALVVGDTAYVANVGDSRTYLYREGQGLSKVTHDHSVVASLVDAGIIKPDDIYTHPKRNQIYRSLGEKPVVEVDTFPVNLLPGDKLLLCSDGLWDMVRDPLIQDVLGKTTGDPNETGQKLIKAALEGGGEDNVSVIVVQFAEMHQRTGMTGVQLLAKPETVTVPNLPPI